MPPLIAQCDLLPLLITHLFRHQDDVEGSVKCGRLKALCSPAASHWAGGGGAKHLSLSSGISSNLKQIAIGTSVRRLCGRYLAILGRPIRVTVPAVTVAPTTLVGSLIRSSNLPHSMQRGVPNFAQPPGINSVPTC